MEDKRKELEKYFINPRCDYRKQLPNFKLNRRGDLLFNRSGRWEVLIIRERLTDSDWVCDMASESGMNYGEFCLAYFMALQRRGIKKVSLMLYGFDGSFKFNDE